MLLRLDRRGFECVGIVCSMLLPQSCMPVCLKCASAGSSKLKMQYEKSKVPQLQLGGEDLSLVELPACFRLPESGINLTCLTLCVLLFTCFTSKEHTIVDTYFQILQLAVKFQKVLFFARFVNFVLQYAGEWKQLWLHVREERFLGSFHKTIYNRLTT